MTAKTRATVEFGDFQTPPALARNACRVLKRMGVSPASIVEPTCGTGAFLRACVEEFSHASAVLGVEVNPEHVRAAQAVPGVRVERDDFFQRDWPATLDALAEPILVIGNPPWVTNSAVGALRGSNLPTKSNFQRHAGLDAITGKSNFDISEWMLLHLLDWLSGRRAVLAMLCKTVVARKVLVHAWTQRLQVASSAMFSIDAASHFGAAVDACLLVCTLEPGAASQECAVYSELNASAPSSRFAFRAGQLVADLDGFSAFGHLGGTSPIKWRSGIKHDCSRVMELRPRGSGTFENGLGEVARLESSHVYPMLKSSEVVKARPTPTRYMLVTQRSVGEDTTRIATAAPSTWAYLQANAEHLDRRASVIYRNRPQFSVFGVGPYSFAPWKVVTSGFYKRLDFRCIGPVEGKPVVLDDTCYFLPCWTESNALALADLLNSHAAKAFLRSFIFWDAKRPITAQLLASLDLGKLAREVGVDLPAWSDAPDAATLLGQVT
jgi:hypothetical protein